jgi:hypothetical protein
MESIWEYEKLAKLENNPYFTKESAKDFFRKNKNKYILISIIAYLTTEERFPFYNINSVFLKAMLIRKDFEEIKEMKVKFKDLARKIGFDRIIFGNPLSITFAKFESFKLFSIYKNLIINQFLTSWVANFYFNKTGEFTPLSSFTLNQTPMHQDLKQFLPLMLRKVNNLKEVNLFKVDDSRDNNSEPLLMELVKSLTHVQGLEHINFTKCQFTEKIVNKLSEFHVENVKTLTLINCPITDIILTEISKLLIKMLNIEKLFLDGNKFSEDAIRKILIPAVGKLPKLDLLSLGSNKFDNLTRKSVGKYVNSWRAEKLYILVLGGKTYTKQDFASLKS